LDRLQRKFQPLKDVEYEKAKIDYVFNMAQHSRQPNTEFHMILDRLKML